MRQLLRRLWYLLRRHQFDADLTEEMDFHREMAQREAQNNGADRTQATFAAKRAFGSVALAQEQARDVWVSRWLQDLARDCRFGVRALRKDVFLTLTVAGVLGCAIAASVIVYTAVNIVVLRPLPFREPETLQFIWSLDTRRPDTRILTSYADYLDWRDRSRSFEDLAAVRFARMNLTRTGASFRAATIAATPNLLPLLGVTPQSGRSFAPDDVESGGRPVALLSHGFWTRVLGSDPSVIGAAIRLNSATYTVIGILPPSMERSGPLQADVWTLLRPEATSSNRTERSHFVIGRLRSGFNNEQAAKELKAVAGALEAEYHDTNAGWSVQVLSSRDLGAGSRLMLTILSAVAGLLLLIACTNVAGLLIARGAARRVETAVRLALGASRLRLVQQWLIEGLLLSIIATAVGIALAAAGVRVVGAWLGDVNPFLAQMALDGSALTFAATLAFVTPLVFSAGPAVAALGSSTPDQLKAGARGVVGSRLRSRRYLVISQFAMTTALLIVTALSVRTAIAIREIPLGFDPDLTLAMRIEVSGPAYEAPEASARFAMQAVRALQELPGVTSVAASTRIPVVDREAVQRFTIDGRTTTQEGDWAGRVAVTPDFMQALRIPLLKGRALGETDTASTQPVALINQALAARYWPTTNPVGERLRLDAGTDRSPTIEIVGVIGDVRSSDADQPPVPQVYLPLSQTPERTLAFFVRATSDPTPLVDAVRRRIATIDADQAVFDIRTMRRFVFDDVAGTVVVAGLFATFGVIAFALALVGLYGMVAWSVVQRTSEIGLRMALGARSFAIVRQLMREGAKLAALGTALGLLVGAGLAQAIRGALYGVSALDPIVFVGVPIVLVCAALLAICGPALRAATVDPLVALRCE